MSIVMEEVDVEAARTAPRHGLGSRLFARWYPKLMGMAERGGQADVRRAQLANASGDTLEIGAGSGLSVPHYGDAVTELVLLEPNEAFHRQLTQTVRALAPLQVAVADGCHPNRDFLAALEASPLQLVDVTHGTMPRAFPTTAPVVHGSAVRP